MASPDISLTGKGGSSPFQVQKPSEVAVETYFIAGDEIMASILLWGPRKDFVAYTLK